MSIFAVSITRVNKILHLNANNKSVSIDSFEKLITSSPVLQGKG